MLEHSRSPGPQVRRRKRRRVEMKKREGMYWVQVEEQEEDRLAMSYFSVTGVDLLFSF